MFLMGHDNFIYHRLMAEACGDPFDRHVFACAIMAAGESGQTLSDGLGLGSKDLAGLFARYFPHSCGLVRVNETPRAPMATEEPDLRQLLLDHRSHETIEEEWLSCIVARRCQGANHLWQDMGLSNRGEISVMLDRHFQSLATKNVGDMKWKKFFYRQLCRQENVLVCKSPNCEVCGDFSFCFGDELPLAGMSLRVV